jgi:fucose 4-O-acetylase-like acetyltransferase
VLKKVPKLGQANFFQLLGRNSLYVYTFQTIFLFVLIPYYSELYVHGYLRNAIDSKIIWKIATVFSTLPLAMVIIIPAIYRENKLSKSDD